MEKKTFFFYLNQNIKNLIERNEGLGKEREKERERARKIIIHLVDLITQFLISNLDWNEYNSKLVECCTIVAVDYVDVGFQFRSAQQERAFESTNG